MSEMKLTYFDGRGRAEMIRLLFKLAGKPFIDNRVGGESWQKFKPSTPKGQVPVLEVDGNMICESMAIARFVARETGLYGADNFEAAICDMVGDTTNQAIDALVVKKFKAKTEEEKAEGQKKIESVMEGLEKLVVAFKKGTFVLGETASLADVLIHSVLDTCLVVVPDMAFTSFPTLDGISTKFGALPAIAEWIRTRPESTF